MPRIQGLTESGILTTDTLLKTGKGYVFSVTIAWAGANAGDKVYFRDGTTGVAPIEVVFVLNAATGSYFRDWQQGKEFDTGIYYQEGTAADVSTSVTYK